MQRVEQHFKSHSGDQLQKSYPLEKKWQVIIQNLYKSKIVNTKKVGFECLSSFSVIKKNNTG